MINGESYFAGKAVTITQAPLVVLSCVAALGLLMAIPYGLLARPPCAARPLFIVEPERE